MYRTWCVLFVLPSSNSSEFINIRSECEMFFFYSRLDKYKFKTMVSHSSSDSGAKIHNFSPLPSYSVIRVNIQFKDVSIFNESFNRIHYKRHSLGPDTVSPSENLHASWVGSSEIECIMKLWDNTSNDRINIRRLQNPLNGRNKTGNSKSNESEHGFPTRTQWWFWSGRSF